jgi:chemotaxis signal transduction protein
VIERCWAIIGVAGDATCPELASYVHCRNCPVHAAAAKLLLEGTPPAGYLAEWSLHIARPRALEEHRTQAVAIFRIATEWLALPVAIVSEVLTHAAIHSLPHRADQAVTGVVNIRGQLLPYASLGRIIGIGAATDDAKTDGRRRLLVICRDDIRVACGVDEVDGVHRFHHAESMALPSTLSKAGARFSTGILSWQDRSVGLLDEQSLLLGLKRSLA